MRLFGVVDLEWNNVLNDRMRMGTLNLRLLVECDEPQSSISRGWQ